VAGDHLGCSDLHLGEILGRHECRPCQQSRQDEKKYVLLKGMAIAASEYFI